MQKFVLIEEHVEEKDGYLSLVTAMEIIGLGCIVRTQTIVATKEGAVTCSESSVFIRNTRIVELPSGGAMLKSS